jgi:hydrogenase maturation protease
MRTLLLGMGNPILSDDAVGVRLAGDLARALPAVPGLDVVEECSVGGLNLLEVLEGYEQLIVLDAVKTEGGLPGDWYRFTLDTLQGTLHLTNIHDVNFATALELGQRLGMLLPHRSNVHVFAVEAEDVVTFSEHMTPALEHVYPELAAAILPQVQALVASCPASQAASEAITAS